MTPARSAGLSHFAPRGHRPAVDNVTVADHEQLVCQVDGRADVVRDDLDPIADVESGLNGRERDDAVLFTEAGDRCPWMSDDVTVTGVAGARIERQRFGASIDDGPVRCRTTDDGSNHPRRAAIGTDAAVPERVVITEDVG